jgi:putative FmdB family regulatory protein
MGIIWCEDKLIFSRIIMPLYDYVCDGCNVTMEIKQSYNDDHLIICPQCKQEKLRRLISAPFFYVKGEPKTLIQQAEANSKKFGRAECLERELKAEERLEKAAKASGRPVKKKPRTPWFRNGSIDGLVCSDKPITPTQVEKYTKELREMGSNVDINATPPQRIKDGKKRKPRSTS